MEAEVVHAVVVAEIRVEEEARNDYRLMVLAVEEEGYIEGLLEAGVPAQIGLEGVSRGGQAQEAAEHVNSLLAVVAVFAREVLHVAHYQDEVVVGVTVGHRVMQATEEPNLERTENSGTAR